MSQPEAPPQIFSCQDISEKFDIVHPQKQAHDSTGINGKHVAPLICLSSCFQVVRPPVGKCAARRPPVLKSGTPQRGHH